MFKLGKFNRLKVVFLHVSSVPFGSWTYSSPDTALHFKLTHAEFYKEEKFHRGKCQRKMHFRTSLSAVFLAMFQRDPGVNVSLCSIFIIVERKT